MKWHGIGLLTAAILAGSLSGCSRSHVLSPDPADTGTGGVSAEVGAQEFSHDDAIPGKGRDFVPWSTNPWFPLVPGMAWHYRSETPDGVETQVVTVTKEFERIQGVKTVVVTDVVRLDGEVIERTRDYYAMDDRGNVWYFGEDTREIDPETGAVSTAGTWRAGRDGARAGIIMLAHPDPGDEYKEEVAPGVAEDRARVIGRTSDINVPAGSFENVLKTENTTPLEPDVLEFKYYARGVGLVREEDVEEDVRNNLVRFVRASLGRDDDDDDDDDGPWAHRGGKKRR